jgi:uncharacterized membrane protein
MRKFFLACLLLAEIGAAAPGSADRRRIVAGWLIEAVEEDDGGRIVRMTRRSGGFRLEFEAVFWHGNDGRIQGTSVERSDCTNGDELDRHVVPKAAMIRAQLASHLADCAASPRQAATALSGIERAYAVARQWAEDAAARTSAEAARIADYGTANEAAPEPRP